MQLEELRKELTEFSMDVLKGGQGYGLGLLGQYTISCIAHSYYCNPLLMLPINVSILLSTLEPVHIKQIQV